MSEVPPEPPAERGGVSAGWVVALVIVLTLGLGAAFFIVANSQPIELVDTAPDTNRADALDAGAATGQKPSP